MYRSTILRGRQRWPLAAALRLALALGAAASVAGQAQALAASAELPTVEVVGTTPLPGIGQSRNEMAAPVQTATSKDIQRSGALDLGDFMNRRLGSVYVNEMQGNPFQMDVSYRGYTASPLLGTQQGLSVYVDGVRMNQPFGDTVSWDLIPRAAISSMSLMPGSNPLFGLNTLGGAVSVQTKDGRANPGTSVQTTLGSNARRAVEFEHGGSNDALDWYVTGNLFKEDGWRNDSPSDVRQVFGKLGWRNAGTTLKLSFAHADNDMTGNGLQEQTLMANDRASVYTKPDQTRNRSTMFNLAATHALNDNLLLSGNAYYRDMHTSTLNGDINEDALSQSIYQLSAAERAALGAAGYAGFPTGAMNAANTPFPYWRCIAQGLLNDEPAEKCTGLINRTETKQQNYGISAQAAWLGDLFGQRNELVAGGAYDGSRINFKQSSQLGYINADRSVTGINAYGDGVIGGNVDGEPFDTRVNLSGRIETWSAFASDTMTFADKWHLTLSGRYNTTSIRNSDQIHADGDPASLSGNHRYSRFNPAIGLTYSPSSSLNLYGGYSESSRAPTAIELGCANPDRPCKLPNAMASDPPLKQVVTRTLEAGIRGSVGASLQWNAGVFSARNQDDILFVADNQSGYGYFKNFGQTKRQGIELGVSSKLGNLEVGGQYTFLDATYQSAETVNGAGNSTNSAALAGSPGQEGNINIKPGDKIPLIPRQMLKLFADYAFSPALTVSAGMVAVAGSLARGNENGQHQPDGKYYLGPGRSAGYAIFNLGAALRVTPQLQVMAQVNNLFDTRYDTAAQLGATAFDGNGNVSARPFGGSSAAGYAVRQSTFYAPGAPRLFWIALRYEFDKPK
ncbi:MULTISPECIES: TonB-dependent receptor [unclassified Herbaspirillum]|uniref:TonB-dependent receptor n=1 Tax=unclassified Herbaspirillum TaxID=2624150 RepID=UPI0011518750|nr:MULTISPECIES: TonB-dependent receptor [unclassified Herbaspirillum]MBB5393127.1 outer membrane receptor protein involved in Fe transport [Herbaspirillum sp. SJZ102]TQK04231.1 outer membrane receptor protein involved in Fe transport [Herbaspirillum sp. SJZ130]TQK09984.1 outer membrane receptor protein involved in Fe transport [Herbaspirillum sp. SJZ106]